MLVVPILSLLLLALAIQRDLRWMLLGPNYSRRLYLTIETVMLSTAVAGVYSLVRRQCTIALASVILALSWLWVGAVNSVV
jgi:hypothetical protein